jgi:hypothetical protein
MANFDTFLENLAGFEDDVYNTEFNITGFLLPDKEAVKKLIQSKNPLFTKDQIDMMIDSAEELIKKKEEIEEKRAKREEEKAKREEEKNSLSKEEKAQIKEEEKAQRKKQRQEEKERRKKELKEQIEAYKEIFKEKIKQMYEEAKNIKQSIKEAAFKLFKELKDLAKKMVMNIIQTASSIPGIITIMSAPPWNIPQAISLALIIVESYLNIISQLKDILPFLTPLKLLPLVTDKANLKKMGAFFNAIVKALRALWIPIKLLNDVIKALIAAVLGFLKKNRSKIFRRATRRLKKFGHLYKFKFSLPFGEFVRGDYREGESPDGLPCYSYDEDDIDEIQELLKTFKIGDENQYTNRVVAYNTESEKSERDLEMIQYELDSVSLPDVDNPEQDLGEEQRFVYDILLPDGSVVKNITEEGIEFYKESYTLTFIDSLTQSFLTQSEFLPY